jgi:hypothetical protein
MKQTLSRASEHDREGVEVLRWRFERLVEIGYDSATASSIAERVEIDLHLAVRLVAEGCPPGTALRILV